MDVKEHKFKEIKNEVISYYIKEITKKLEKRSIDIDTKCSDNFVATVKFNGSKWSYNISYIDKNEREINDVEIKEKGNPRIIIILESPHIDEYSLSTPYPAIGATGKNINKYFTKILNKFLNNKIYKGKEYDLILMNAVQYQTSLGYNTEIFRDRIWLKTWLEAGGREDFIDRLKSYNPDIIFNLCTKCNHSLDVLWEGGSNITWKYIQSLYGKEKLDGFENKNIISKKYKIGSSYIYPLYGFVDNAIEEVSKDNNNIVIVRGSHPSSWTRMGVKGKWNKFIKHFKKMM